MGFSEISKYDAIQDLDEARSYLQDPVLGGRLITLCSVLLELENASATEIFGYPDDLKLRSCMTLFAKAAKDKVFESVLKKYYNGVKDLTTLQILHDLK